MTAQPSPYLRRFIIIYAAANIGVIISFIPLLVLLLPLKAALIAPTQKLLLLSTALCSGAVTAAICNILSGWLSDWQMRVFGHRFFQIAFGLCAIILSYGVFWYAESWSSLIIAAIFFQISLNIIYAPIGALLVDYVPDNSKGRTAAFINLGVPAGSLTIAVLTLTIFQHELSRLIALGGLVALCVLPLLYLAMKRQLPDVIAHEPVNPEAINIMSGDKLAHMDLFWAWISRLFIQFSSALLLGYIAYYIQDIVGYTYRFPYSSVDEAVGTLNLMVIPFAVGGALIAGFWSDRRNSRRPFLYVTAATIALALCILINEPQWPVIIIAYIVFSASLAIFQTIDAALITQMLSNSSRRGRIMGYMNLGYTLPAIMIPALAIILSSDTLPADVLRIMLGVSALLAVLAIVAIAQIRSVP